MRTRRPRLLAGLLMLATAAPWLAGCETAPATGRTFFTGGLSADSELALGRQEHEKIVPQFGGVYDDPDLAAYVSSIGQLLARTSETPDLTFTVTVLDTPIVNAFALPGGYVYVTRGLMALADNEAELAGVLAHEIGHVTARHSAERYGQQMAAGLAGLGLGILTGSNAVARAVGTGSTLAIRSFSREQEFEADLLGIRYMTRAGYDPGAVASFLAKLDAESRLDAELRGRPGRADEFNIMSTHPRTRDRVAAAVQRAGVTAVRDPMTARDIYLGKIDGMLYGDDPEQGFIRGRRFLHPKLRFAFEVPEGFRLFNSSRAVTARGPEGATIVFSAAQRPSTLPMPLYLSRVWAQGVDLAGVEAIVINGMAAATGLTRLNTSQGPREVRLVAIRYDPKTIYRMMFLTPPALSGPLNLPLRRTTYSFRRLGAAEAARLKPLRLRVVTVKPGDTVHTLAARMAFDDYQAPRFRVLNGLSETDRLKVGQKVKIITE